MNLRDRLEKNLGAPSPQKEKSELRGKLEQLAAEKTAPAGRRAPREAIEEVLGGQLVDTPHGRSVLVSRHYPATHRHGAASLSSFFQIAHRLPSIQGKDKGSPLEGLTARDLLFLDTETTGLSGGAGTCAFLIGAGFFEGEVLHVHQFFMRDFNEEKAMLSHFSTLLDRAKGLVTFNGRCFDVPLIDERFILNRSRISLRALPHLDLLHPSRRLFKGLYADCRLVTLEEQVLKMERHGDIDGSLIPACYFDYVRTGRSEMIEQIFSHNRNDIVTLVALTAAIAGLIDDPLTQSGMKLVKLGRFHQQLGDAGLGRECLEFALQETLTARERMEAMRHLSLQHRREKRYDEAALLWEMMARDSRMADPFPLIELAKYYEHRKGNPGKALEMTMQAMAALSSGRTGLISSRKDLEKRLERLERKVRGDQGATPTRRNDA
jgi:uncharacterized protein